MLHCIRTAAIAAVAASAAAIAPASHAGDGIEPLTTELVAPLLRYPTGAVAAPGDFTRFYIMEKRGVIRVLNLKTGEIAAAPFLDIDSQVGGGGSTGDERGLLGLAFSPNWQDDLTFYVNYTNNSGATVVARYTAADRDSAGSAPGQTILTISQPFSNHNAGWMDFSPFDGYLYIATGDGGSGGDPGNRAQDITNQLLGKMLRLDVSDYSTTYTIPKDNPFVGVIGDDEIWAYGLRNPWRNSFDRAGGDLYIADVGQNAIEELNYQRFNLPGGRNYGWRCKEGLQNFNFGGNCASQIFTDPFYTYPHSQGFSITGGFVYRGCAIPTLDGTYFFADYGSSRIWTVDAGGGTGNFQVRTSELAPPTGAIQRISSFAQDNRGELYIIDQGTGFNGELFRILPVTPTISDFDLDCSGAVDFNDLLTVLASYGPCDGCQADFDGDHDVDFDDLLTLLAAWG